LLIPVTFGQGITQVNMLVDSLFASFMVTGAMASLEIADRVMEFVLGGFVIALTTAVLPLLSRQAAQGRTDDMKSTMTLAMRIALFITFPSAIGLIVLREQIVHVLFEYGEFTAQSTALTAWALLFFALGLPAFSMLKIAVSAFYALQDTRTPVKIAFMAMLVNIVMNVIFFFLIPALQNGGPALATSLAAFFNSISLLVIFRSRHGRFGLRAFARSLAKFVIAGATMGVIAYTMIYWPGFFIDQPRPQKALALLLTIGLSAGAYFAMTVLMRSPEVSELRDIVRRRRGA
jgi:putative peptidoglycan lipid II flippase